MKVNVHLVVYILFVCCSAIPLPCWGQAELLIQSKASIDFKLQGYYGLEESTIFSGVLSAGGSRRVETQYRGLAMLIFSGGQQYPLIIGSQPSVVTIINSSQIPSFAVEDENQLFYKFLSDDVQVDNVDSFVGVMIRGKQLLDSSGSIKTVKELHEKKGEFQEFLQHNYRDLSHSDLLRRLLGQYFMMHEYVSYHRENSPAGDIQIIYRQEVLSGVRTLLAIFQDHIPKNELLNYCVGLYYNRGMVTMASFIADHFESFAYCGDNKQTLRNVPANQTLINSDGSEIGKFGELQGEITVSFVSYDCPVSMVRTVIKAREIADANSQGGKQLLIVVPLEQLSEKHRSMSRNVSGVAMLFVDDESWSESNLQNIRLPFIQKIPVQ